MYQSQVCFMIQVISDETKANQNSLKYAFIWTILIQFQGKFDKSYPNNRGWRKKILNLMKGESLIRVWRVENFSKINKQAPPFIRNIRVTVPEQNFLFNFLLQTKLLFRILIILKCFLSYSSPHFELKGGLKEQSFLTCLLNCCNFN